MTDSTSVVYFHLTNIPATEEAPFDLYAENSVIFSTPEAIPSDAECVVEAEMPVPRVSEFHKIYVRAHFKANNIDVVAQVNLTSNGYHVLIRFGDQGDRVELKQSESGDFDTGTTFSEELFDEVANADSTSELQEGYTYNKPKLNVLNADQVESIMSQKDTFTTLYFHLANIPASKQEPFHVNAEAKILVMLTEAQPLNKIETHEAKILNPKIAEQHVVNLRIKITACDIDVKQAFNLTERGNHILIAMINDGENIKILQSKNDKFDVPFQKPPTSALPASNIKPSTSSPASKPITGLKAVVPDPITFYLEGIDASFIKPFKIIINKKEYYKLTTPIPAKQMSIITCDVPRTSLNDDNIIDVQFMLLKQGWKEPVAEQFNVTQAGKFIKVRVFQEGDSTFNLDILQQFGPFVPESGVKAVTQEKKALDSFINKIAQQDAQQAEEPAKVSGTQVKTTPSNVSQTASFAQTKTTTTVKEFEPQLISSSQKVTTTSTPISSFIKNTNTTTSNPAPASKASDLSNVLADIEKLAELTKKGILTPEEFAMKKKQLLGL